MVLRAFIVSQGDEITSGGTLDSNAHWLAGELFARGAKVVGMGAAPDDAEALARLLSWGASQAHVLISGGGLGPTDDDVTAEAMAKASGKPLRLEATALAQVQARFDAMGRTMAPANRRQAMLPEGATLLENAKGTAPGFSVVVGGCTCFCFAGVPRELKHLCHTHLFPWLKARGLKPNLRQSLHACGVPESELQQRLGGLRWPAGVRLGYKTHLPYNSAILYVDGGLPNAPQVLAEAEQQARARLGVDCYGVGDETLPQILGALLVARGLTLAIAESCTAGGTMALATEAAGASAWLLGGVVSYANAVKRDLLGVPQALFDQHGAVSEPVAIAMAEGVRQRLGASIGVGITGIAGPGGGTAQKPVGTVCTALALPGETLVRTMNYGDRGRDWVRTLAAATALEWLRRRLA